MEAQSGPRGTGSKVLRLALAVVLFGGTALVLAHDWLGFIGPSIDQLSSGALYDAVVVAAGLACLLRARAVPRERWAWLLIGLGILAWAAGEIYYAWKILENPSPPYPSPADLGFLLLYPLAGAGLVLLIRARAHQLDWRLWTDGVIAALGTAALGAVFIFDYVAENTTGTTIEVATSLAYPVGDIVFLALIMGTMALAGWRPDRTWSLLLAGLAAQAVADVAYTLQATSGALPAGNWVDPIYLISASLLGAVLWAPTATLEARERFGAWRELSVPGIFAAVMIGLFAMQYFSATSGLSAGLWAATIIAVIVRLAISVRENRILLDQVRTDTLTGLRNRGAMQIEIEDLFRAASAEAPAAVVLLDLNGFKRYNDTFGHLAGDELLGRLGHQLKNAVQPYGNAYRIGGDEFCVLLSCPEADLDDATRAAATGLSEKGKGYDITASWGVAIVPREASVASEALGLADVRMYAQKESRRLAPDSPDISSLSSPDDGNGAGEIGLYKRAGDTEPVARRQH
jgi:diguanylate cyclase (GGDEF)-like protein